MSDLESEKTKNKRVVVYIPEELLRKLRANLALSGINLSEWVREKAREQIG